MSKETINVVIESRENQGHDIAVLNLRSPKGQILPSFSAGSHIDVHISEGLIRQYSLSNSASEADLYRIAVLKTPDSTGGSETLFNRFTPGQVITISHPRNHFPLQANHETTLLVAGGIGITPLLSMAYALREEKKTFEVHYCLKTNSAGAFLDELLAEFPDETHVYCDDERMLDPKEMLRRHSNKVQLYTCGPAGFMEWVIEAAKDRGLNQENIHFEYFTVDANTEGDSFEVYCAISDVSVTVDSEETIANALENQGVDIDVSCEQGICGTCITDVLEGEPDHRDYFLTEDEREANDKIAICCSRSKGRRLVIDI